MSPVEVIEQARRGDPKATEQLAEMLRDRIRRTAHYYAGRTGMDRDDLQQEMWLGLLLGLQQVDLTIGDPLFYLFLRAKWRLLEAIRKSDRESAETLDPALSVPGGSGCEDEVIGQWMTCQLSSRLRGAQRLILEALLQGYRQDELAQALGCTAANVCYHVGQIRKGYQALAADN